MKVRYYMGMLITFEGPEGGGKTTIVRDLAKHLKELGLEPLIEREPGTTNIGEQVREILKNPKNVNMESMTEALLFQAARAQICKEIIIPALNNRKIVIMDRFRDSSVAYQGVARNLGKDVIDYLNDLSTDGLMPDTTILLNLRPEVGIARLPNASGCRLDSESINFHQKVHDAYLDMVKEDKLGRWVVVDAERPYEQVMDEVFHIVESKLRCAGYLERENLGKERF